jgi:hypothetical protein
LQRLVPLAGFMTGLLCVSWNASKVSVTKSGEISRFWKIIVRYLT